MKRKVEIFEDEEAADVEHSNTFIGKLLVSLAIGAVLFMLFLVWFLRATH